MSSMDDSQEKMISEKYLSAFSNRESDIIRSVVASVLAGDVPRDSIAEAVQIASGQLHNDAHAGTGGCADAMVIMGVGESCCETSDHCDDGWATEDGYERAHSSSIHVDQHDREMQRLLATEKMLQADLMNMGLVVEDEPLVSEISASSAPAMPCHVHNPHKQDLHVDAPACGLSRTFQERYEPKSAPLLDHQAVQMGAVPVTDARSTSAWKTSKLRTAHSPATADGKCGHYRPRARARSGGPGHSISHTQSKAKLSPAPIPRVAFLGAQPYQSKAQEQRNRCPLVGGLQSELDNDEAYTILEDTLKRTGRINPGRERDLYSRQVAWRARVEANADVIRRELQQEEISKCSFRPRLDKRSKSQPHAVAPSAAMQEQANCGSHPLWDVRMKADGSSESVRAMLPTIAMDARVSSTDGNVTREYSPRACTMKPGHRLYEQGREKARKLAEKRKAIQLEQEKQWLPRPARRLSRQIYPEGCLLGSVNKPVARENLRAWEHMWDPAVNPTFWPATNFGTHMRRSTRRRAKSMGAVPDRGGGTRSQPLRTRFQAPYSDELDFHEFLTRQARHGTRRAARVEEIQHELKQCLSRTVPMAPGTRRLLSQRMSRAAHGHGMRMHSVSLEEMVEPYEDGPPNASTPSMRSGNSLTPRQEFAKESEVENCTFRPQIRPSSHVRAGRTVEELSAGDYASRSAKIQQWTLQKEEMMKKETPFKPQLFSPSKSLAEVKGKIARDHAYVQRCRDKEVQKERKRQIHQARQMEQEMKECTFCPRTGRMPRLIQDMIRAPKCTMGTSEPPVMQLRTGLDNRG